MKIAITGHRPHKLGNDYDLTSPLLQLIKYQIENLLAKYDFMSETDLTLITGMALGIDTLFAQIAISLRIPFIAAIPCKGQYTRWPKKSVDQYFNILTQSHDVFLVDHRVSLDKDLDNLKTCLSPSGNSYSTQKMQQRNIWMVNNCNLLIAVWDGSSGGTANCVKYAQSVGKQIIHINPKEL